jgi:hypothetical protein
MKNEWSYTSIHPHAFIRFCLNMKNDIFTFTLGVMEIQNGEVEIAHSVYYELDETEFESKTSTMTTDPLSLLLCKWQSTRSSTPIGTAARQ